MAQSAATGSLRGTAINASNGLKLENVVVKAAGRQTITNQYGEYEFTGLPVGPVEVTATYVGEPDITRQVNVGASEVAMQDFIFREAVAGERREDGTFVLNPFTVNAERYRNARAQATAEERNSVNIKSVVATDQFGYVPSGNVGEFTKFLPGIQLDYGASGGNNQGFSEGTANGISVRGFGPEDTAILIDGLPVSSTLPGNLTRQVGLDQLSINNASRVELIKVPTPDMPANAPGGQVNLVTRNAFEQAKPSYSARLFFNYNDQATEIFKKTPGPVNKQTYKTTPGVELSASYPFSKSLGFSFTGAWNQEYSNTWRGQPVWNNSQAANFQNGAFTNAAGQASSIANPVLTRYQITESPSLTTRSSGNFRVDWRPTPNQTIRANVQYSTYETAEAQRRLDFRPTIAAGADWDGTKVIGTTANSTTAMTVTTRDRIGDTISGQVSYDANFWGFQIKTAASYSKSSSDFEDEANGHYSGLDLNLNPGRVALYGLDRGLPARAETFTRSTNLPLDYTQLSNWSIANALAQSGQAHNEREVSLWKIDIERPLDFLHFLGSNSLTFKTGYRYDEDVNKKSGRGTGYRQILKPGATFTVADILDTDYLGQSPGFGLAAQQWASTYKLFQLNQRNNLFFEPTENESTNTAVNNYNSFVNQQKNISETIDAWYAQLSGRFVDGRLNFVGGVRQETRGRTGRGPFTDNKWNYIKRADGSLYTDAANPNGVTTNSASSNLFAQNATGTALRAALTQAGIAFPTTPYGATNVDINARKLQLLPLREINQEVKGDPSYSFSSSYRLTKKIDLKAAWSRSFKLQPLESGNVGILSANNQFTFTEFTPAEQTTNNGARGQISIANPGLKPEISNSWDFETSYFTDSGGKLTVSYYNKTVENAIMTFTTYEGTPEFNSVMTALGFNPSSYEDWRIVTTANSDTVQKTSGWEFEVRQDFGFLGKWGRRVSGFASYSMTDTPAPSAPVPYTITNPDGTTTQATPSVSLITLRANRFGGAGLQYADNRLSVQLRGTYRNDNERGANRLVVNNQVFRQIEPAETRIDLNVNYVLTKNYGLFLSGRDIFHGEREILWRHDGGQLPDYASLNDLRRFGVTWTVGITGSW